MSHASVKQLRESYRRIIDATLKQVRDAHLIRDSVGMPPREVADELGRRWRAAVERRLEAMESEHKVRLEVPRFSPPGSDIAALPSLSSSPLLIEDDRAAGELAEGSDTIGLPSALPAAIRDNKTPRHMDCVMFADSFALPAPLPKERLPAEAQCRGGFQASHVDDPSAASALTTPSARSVGMVAREPPSKRPRRSRIPPSTTPAGTSVGVKEAPSTNSGVSPVVQAPTQQIVAAPAPAPPPPDTSGSAEGAAAADDSDNEYAGMFDDAEVIVAASRDGSSSSALVGTQAQDDSTTGGGAAEAVVEGSEGSELGSDLDEPLNEPEAVQNVLFADLKKVTRTKKQWKVDFRQAVLQIDGIECLISEGTGVFSLDAETS